MPFIPTPQGVHVEIEYIGNGRSMYNILTVDLNAAVTESLVNDVAGYVAGWAQVDLPVVIGEDMVVQSVLAKGMESVETWQAVVTSGFPTPGEVLSPLLPNSIAACVSFRTGFTGRSARGRAFMPGLTEAQVLGNTIDAGWVTNIQTAWNSLRTVLDSNFLGGGLAVTSFVEAGVPRVAGRQLLVTSIQVDGRVDTQRRRLGD